MTKLILSTIIALILTTSPWPAFAAEMDAPSGKWWRHPRVAQRLNLTQEEINQLDNAFIDSRRKLIELKGNVEIEQLELEALIENRTLNESDALKQYQQLEKARMALGTERFIFFMSVRKIIGYDKFQQLMIMKKNRDKLKQSGK